MYVLAAYLKVNAASTDLDDISNFVLLRLQIIKFVTSTMMPKDDIHMDQLAIGLKHFLEQHKELVTKVGIWADCE
jgi:hypothetical protein